MKFTPQFSFFLTLMLCGCVLPSLDGGSDAFAQSAWTARASGTGNSLHRVIWTGPSGPASGQLLAVGDAGTILTSPDGVSWTARSSGTTQALWGAAANSSQIVVTGDNGTVLTSTDGVNWTAHAAGTTGKLYAVTWMTPASNSNQWVAVGSGVSLTSPDGIYMLGGRHSRPRAR